MPSTIFLVDWKNGYFPTQVNGNYMQQLYLNSDIFKRITTEQGRGEFVEKLLV